MKAIQHERISLERYRTEHRSEWDDFVESSRNGTFLFMRGYMDYHSDRFNDHSLIFRHNGRITALLPANKQGDCLYSHSGLTYGGLLLSDKTTAVTVLQIFRCICEYMEQTGIKELIYRPVPHIYHKRPCEEDLYALFRCNATLTERKISSATALHNALPFGQLRRRKIKTAQAHGIEIAEDGPLEAFWNILTKNLLSRHNVSPTHSLDEMQLLQSRFPRNIRLFTAMSSDNRCIAGVLMYITEKTAHAQYIAADEEGKSLGALDLLFAHLICNRFPDMEYFDFGVSVEQGGRKLNEGLIFQKEGFGGRAVMYDTYSLKADKADKE